MDEKSSLSRPGELRVLTWNLFHGRSVPPAGRDLEAEFAAGLAAWSWDVALLQEVPPWWPAPLAGAADAFACSALTSRNSLPALRRAVAVRRPDLLKSGGGGANAILVRHRLGAVTEHRTLPLARRPERRVMHAVRLELAGAQTLWVGNLHATVRNDAAARREAAVAARTLSEWAGPGTPAVLGGDFNVRGLELAGYARAAVNDVDMVFAAGLGPDAVVAPAPERGRLSDHAPLLVTLTTAPSRP